MVPPTLRPAAHCHNGSGASCANTGHPTTKGSTYCTTHQTICLLCPSNPWHSIGKKCKSCVTRIRAERRAKEKADKKEKAVDRERRLEEREAEREAARQEGRRAWEAKKGGKRKRRKINGGKKKRMGEQVIEEC